MWLDPEEDRIMPTASAAGKWETGTRDVIADAPSVHVPALLGRVREHVPAYGSGGFTSYDKQQTREQLAGWVERDRVPRVKIKIGESWGSREARDLSRVALARQVIGPDTELFVDANGGYSTGQAVRVAHQMAEYGVTWCEEPVSSQDLAGLASVRSQVLPDVAAWEYSWSLADSARLIEADAVDGLQLDLARCGGITEFARGAALAAAHSIQVSAHCAPTLHAHVGAATPNLRHVEYFHDHQRIGCCSTEPSTPGAGCSPPTRPGPVSASSYGPRTPRSTGGRDACPSRTPPGRAPVWSPSTPSEG
jgi:L-alanine-DL-glutamate epimerase-like enolase superfamily enzyme